MLLALEGNVNSITATLETPDRFDAFALALTQDKQDGLDAARETAYYDKISSGMADVSMALGFAEAFIFSLGAVCATMIVFYGAVAQRRREVGVLRALGFGRLTILSAFLAESIALSLAGGAIGVVLWLVVWAPWARRRRSAYREPPDEVHTTTRRYHTDGPPYEDRYPR